MEVELILKIASIGILVAVLNQVLDNSGKKEYTMLTTILGLVLVLFMVIEQVKNLFDIAASFVKSFGY